MLSVGWDGYLYLRAQLRLEHLAVLKRKPFQFLQEVSGCLPQTKLELKLSDGWQCVLTRPQWVPATRIELIFFVLIEPYSDLFENDRVASRSYYLLCWIIAGITFFFICDTVHNQEFYQQRSRCYQQSKANTVIELKRIPSQVSQTMNVKVIKIFENLSLSLEIQNRKV